MRHKSILALVSVGIISAGTAITKEGALPAATASINLPTLTCENNDLFTISMHGTEFYACYTDVFPSPPEREHTKQLYGAIDLAGKVKEYSQKALGFSETRNYREYRPGNASELIEEGSAYFMLYIIPSRLLLKQKRESIYYLQENTAQKLKSHCFLIHMQTTCQTRKHTSGQRAMMYLGGLLLILAQGIETGLAAA